MYFKTDTTTIAIKAMGDAESWTVPLDDFSMIASMRLSPDGERLLLTGVVKGDALPSMMSNDKGEIKPYLYARGETSWQRIAKQYALDAVFIPGTDTIAFHNGNGLTVMALDGTKRQEFHQGQFHWGAPSLSVSPASQAVSWIRWKGDEQKINIMHLASGTVEHFAPSLYRYAWRDETSIWFENGSALKELDITTGKAHTVIRSLQQAFAKGNVETSDAQLLALFAFPAEDQETSYGAMTAHEGDLYFAADHLCWQQRERKVFIFRVGTSRDLVNVNGLFRLTSDQRVICVESIAANEHIEEIGIHPDGTRSVSITKNRGTRSARGYTRVSGSYQRLIETGWSIMPSNHTPAFGVHWMGG